MPMALVVAVNMSPVQAGEWRLTPRLSIQETYTDNIDLAPQGEERSDFVTSINPGLGLSGRGGRVNVNLQYTMQNLRHKRDDIGDSTNHQLQAGGDVELIEQMLSVNARATASQQNRDNRGRIATSNISNTGNREDVYTFAITPVFRHHFGKYADTEASTTYDWVENGGDGDASTSGGFQARMNSGRYFARVPWSISYSTRTLDGADGGEDNEFESLSGTLTYVFSRRYSVFTSVGHSRNDTNNQDIESSGIVWSAGLNWTPSPRTSFSGGLEKNPVGDNVFFDFQHRRRRSVWSASLSQSATTARDLQLERILIPLEDPFGEPIETPDGDIILIPIDTVRQTDEVFVDQTFNASMAMQGRRSTVRLGINWSERDNQGDDDETVQGLSFGLNHTLSRAMSANLDGRWQETEFDLSDRTSEIWSLGLGLSYSLARNATGQVNLRHIESASDGGTNDYKENRLTAGLNFNF
ncbi:MAG: TIGR03016 family PEP-CTERM system-associated outer membrane protein [Gammaproteobacteria bacterium]|nr:TIGR03016 family PEP-CTERM system-associated outer membrane protein [Gammaproteobacteria bacterium]